MEEKQRRRKTDKMADKAQVWISTMWPILVCIVGLVYHSATFKANVNSKIDTMITTHKFELKAIGDNVKRNELRTARLESSIISSESKLTGISKKIDLFVAQLKYIYPTKSYVDKELKKKADRNELDARNFKKAYREIE